MLNLHFFRHLLYDHFIPTSADVHCLSFNLSIMEEFRVLFFPQLFPTFHSWFICHYISYSLSWPPYHSLLFLSFWKTTPPPQKQLFNSKRERPWSKWLLIFLAYLVGAKETYLFSLPQKPSYFIYLFQKILNTAYNQTVCCFLYFY